MNTLIESESDKSVTKAKKMQTLLLFEDLQGHRMAMPFGQATRLEEFAADAVEYAGDQYVVQYREDIMPLVFIPSNGQSRLDLTEESENSHGEMIHVIVHRKKDQNIGLVVKNILDIVEEEITVKGFSQDETVLFTTVLQGHVVEVLDIDKLLIKKMINQSRPKNRTETEVEGA